ncbi:MAG TPA: hypothetical protein VMV42_00735 [archaeon]|nr:hypothetical protein [archaeon]
MTRLLLDHPWPIDSALDASSDAHNVLLDFHKFVTRHRLPSESIVRFIVQQDYDDALQRIKGRTAGATAIRRFTHHLIRNDDRKIGATPKIAESIPPLSDCWKHALRDELDHLENWRNPQILFPEKRRSVWPTDEVSIKCDDRDVEVSRVVASLEEYESHKYAVPDNDPWSHLWWLHRPTQDVDDIHPCRLPRPPVLESVIIENLNDMLPVARSIGWKVNDRYYFVPPESFKAEIEKSKWRRGEGFEQKKKHGWKGPSLVDYQGQIWCWDLAERHWDVQLKKGNYIRISHDGRQL